MIDQERLEAQGRPASIHAEMTILGAMLVEPLAAADALNTLVASDFSIDSHRRIYAAMVRLTAANSPLDIVTLSEELRKKKELDSVGSVAYLAQLSEGLPRKLSIDSYVSIVLDKARARGLMDIADLATMTASDGSEDSLPLIERTIESLRAMVESYPDNDLQQVGDYLATQGEPEHMFDKMATVNGIMTGFGQLDEVLLGLQAEDLVIVGARPSMGKTAWVCCVAQHVAVRNQKNCVVFTLEQKKDIIIRRMLASSARIDYKAIRKGELRPQDKTILLDRRAALAQSPLYLDDTRGLTCTRIRAKCLRLKRKLALEGKTLDLVMVDQLSHVSGEDVSTRGMDLRIIVGKQTKALKDLAKELGCPVVVFNQLTRPSKGNSVNIPTLADLKESGNIEEDADVVIFLHRPEYYDKTDDSLKGKGQMIVAKQREGELKTCECEYHGRIMRWEDTTQPAAQQTSLSNGYHDPYRGNSDADRYADGKW